MKTYEFGYGDGQIRFEIDDADVMSENEEDNRRVWT